MGKNEERGTVRETRVEEEALSVFCFAVRPVRGSKRQVRMLCEALLFT